MKCIIPHHPRWIRAVSVASNASKIDAAARRIWLAAAAEEAVGVGQVTLGSSGWPGKQAASVARAAILEAAAASIVAAHGFMVVVGLGPITAHKFALPEMILNAKDSAEPHWSGEVAATRSGAWPELLVEKTIVPDP